MTPAQPEYIITDEQLDDIGASDATANEIIAIAKSVRSRPYNEQAIRQYAQEEIMDEFGILHGEAAERFNEYLNDPEPVKSPEAKAIIKRAWEQAQKTSERAIRQERERG